MRWSMLFSYVTPALCFRLREERKKVCKFCAKDAGSCIVTFSATAIKPCFLLTLKP